MNLTPEITILLDLMALMLRNHSLWNAALCFGVKCSGRFDALFSKFIMSSLLYKMKPLHYFAASASCNSATQRKISSLILMYSNLLISKVGTATISFLCLLFQHYAQQPHSLVNKDLWTVRNSNASSGQHLR